ncbi:MAG: hypothetical protein HDR33_07010 [Treponema sp.]|nr:hypothetical protein [Treponema sp.]
MKTIKRICAVVMAAFALCATLYAQSASKPTVIIMPFETSGGVSQEDCDIVTEMFESKYVVASNCTVINHSTIAKTQAVLSDSNQADSRNPSLLGQALNAQQVVKGQIRLYNDIVYFTVQVQDIGTLAVLASVNIRVKSTMQLLDKIPGICKDLAGQVGGTSK